MRIGYFSADGKCIAICSGGGEYPEAYKYHAEVPTHLGPNTCEFRDGRVVEIEQPPPPEPIAPAKTMDERIAELEALVAKLTAGK